MRVCDRHPRTRATARLHLDETDETFDLCPECVVMIRDYLNDQKRDSVEPKTKRKWFKNSAQAE